ncbi:glycosyltransferase [Confluentibacter citreus]|uniref:glycosyltransferase n=1 Tax=Confluentibacter citreus TaxID=2007307 RepID=UPI000C286631|nr:glycosyltransferase [Confluentibacter citreus]
MRSAIKIKNPATSSKSAINKHVDYKDRLNFKVNKPKNLPKVLILSTYPPRQCGIATYTQDLKNALDNTYENSFDTTICAVESNVERHTYEKDDVDLVLNTDDLQSFILISKMINADENIELVMVQHEFGLFKNNEDIFINFLKILNKPIILAFHTVLPNPTLALEVHVKALASTAKIITVMTKSSSELLINTYGINPRKIEIIPHGTHLVKHKKKSILKEKYNLSGRKVISTFGLLGPGKSIETTLDALPNIIKEHKNIIFLVIGKTHPTLFNREGNTYMDFLQRKVEELKLNDHVKFITKFVPLPELLEYLQLSDCYVFTSKDPNQAVSGTFSYAVSCGCPIISTPIPHANEVLRNGSGVLFDFGNSEQLAKEVNTLLNNKNLRNDMKLKGLHASSATSWENASIAHAHIFSKEVKKPLKLTYKKPQINLDHLKAMTTDVGIIQFSIINTPDLKSGYTVDDNARALIAMCQHYKLTHNPSDLKLIKTYINFILKCQRCNGLFLNYVDKDKKFTKQNDKENLEDANGRAIWSLGYAYSLMEEAIDLDITLLQNMKWAINEFQLQMQHFKSPRALAFIIKGLFFFNMKLNSREITISIEDMGNKLVDLYKFHSEDDWNWYEPYLTYANSVLPEALLCAWKATGKTKFKLIAKESFDFLLSKTFDENSIKIICNQNWLIKGSDEKLAYIGGEQPIDVTYTILALKQFNLIFPLEDYDTKMKIAFSWFLGNNQLEQIIYNSCTGGCHDGLEANNVNLNQGAESTVSYLLARLAFEEMD